MALLWPHPRRFESDELESVTEVAGVVAAAVERLRMNELEHHIATQLQDRALQLGVCSTAAAALTVYQPASHQVRVGGDWYTAIALDERRLGLSVGDVGGHGVEAVATMTQLRGAVDAAALTSGDPSFVLDVLDRYAETTPGAEFATAAYAIVDSASYTVRYSCAGHHYPLLVSPSGAVQFLTDSRRPAIEIRTHRLAPSGEVSAEPGSLLLLYTDGLIERRGEALDAGFTRLADAAASLSQVPVGEVCAHLLRVLEPSGGYDDDVALAAVRPCGATSTSFVDVFPANTTEVPRSRQRLREWLETTDLDSSACDDVLVSVSEAWNNGIEHGSGFDPLKTVAVEIFLRDGVVSASVTDRGGWKHRADSARPSYRGHGLAVIRALSEEVTTAWTAFGTCVTMTRGYTHTPPT